MIRLDHLAIPVRDHARSREWYTKNFGFKVEFEVPSERLSRSRTTATSLCF